MASAANAPTLSNMNSARKDSGGLFRQPGSATPEEEAALTELQAVPLRQHPASTRDVAEFSAHEDANAQSQVNDFKF